VRPFLVGPIGFPVVLEALLTDLVDQALLSRAGDVSETL